MEIMILTIKEDFHRGTCYLFSFSYYKITLFEKKYITVPDHVTFLNQVTYSGNLVQTELPIERKPNQITFG